MPKLSSEDEPSEGGSVVVGSVKDHSGNQIGVEVFEDFDAFHDYGPEIEARDHVGRVCLVGERSVKA